MQDREKEILIRFVEEERFDLMILNSPKRPSNLNLPDSWRKMMEKVGSQWVEEREEAEMVREDDGVEREKGLSENQLCTATL